MSGGSLAYARQNSGLVNDFIQRLRFSRAVVGQGLICQLVEASGVNVRVNLAVPLVGEIVLQPAGDFPSLLFRELAKSCFDFSHSTHGEEYGCWLQWQRGAEATQS
jgi:hypothetical protein